MGINFGILYGFGPLAFKSEIGTDLNPDEIIYLKE